LFISRATSEHIWKQLVLFICFLTLLECRH
jgi:hypothetical protein